MLRYLWRRLLCEPALRLMRAKPWAAAYAPIQLRYANFRIRDGFLNLGTLNPTVVTPPSVAPTINPTGDASSGGNLQAGTYYAKYTWVNSSGGETTASPESLQFTVVAGDIPQITIASLPGSASSANVYITPTNGAVGTEELYATGVAPTTYNMQNPFVLGGVAPPTLNSTGSYAAGVSSLAISGLTVALTNGLQFTIGGDPTTYKILTHTETLGVTTSVTMSPGLLQLAYSGAQVTFGPHILLIKIGEGNLTYSDKRPIVYVRNRGILDTVRLGEDDPVDVKFEFTWEFITSVSGSGLPTVEDALKKIGEASAWVTTSTDPCEPYCVDIEVEYIPPCASVDREIISFTTFRYEDLAHDIKNSQISVTGKANIIQPTVTRAA